MTQHASQMDGIDQIVSIKCLHIFHVLPSAPPLLLSAMTFRRRTVDNPLISCHPTSIPRPNVVVEKIWALTIFYHGQIPLLPLHNLLQIL